MVDPLTDPAVEGFRLDGLFRAIAGARAPVRHEEDGKLNYWRMRLEEAKTIHAAAAVVKRFVERQRRRAL